MSNFNINKIPILPLNNIEQTTMTQLQIQNLIYLYYFYNEFTSSIINGSEIIKNINNNNIENSFLNLNEKNILNSQKKKFPIIEGREYIIINKNNKKKIFCCKYPNCNNIYRSKENLILHFKNKHLMEKPYHCNFCNASFSHRNGKIYHERKEHTKIFPHICFFQNCQMKFPSKSSLNYHLKHTHNCL